MSHITLRVVPESACPRRRVGPEREYLLPIDGLMLQRGSRPGARSADEPNPEEDQTLRKFLLLLASHGVVGLAGFAAGIYFLPILTAPPAPTLSEVREAAVAAVYTGEFRRDLADSDALHWGEGTVSVGPETITLEGAVAPGPDYVLYLSPEFVETEADFLRLKPEMSAVGSVKTFENFVVPVPEDIDPGRFNTVIVWCESFGQFITAARYRPAG